MTQEEILEYNNRCAEFLGYVNTTPSDKDFNIYQNKEGKMLETMSMQFHSDWNWIMEVVEAIEKLNFSTKILDNGMSIEKDKVLTLERWGETKEEGVINTINQFLIWYNENNRRI